MLLLEIYSSNKPRIVFISFLPSLLSEMILREDSVCSLHLLTVVPSIGSYHGLKKHCKKSQQDSLLKLKNYLLEMVLFKFVSTCKPELTNWPNVIKRKWEDTTTLHQLLIWSWLKLSLVCWTKNETILIAKLRNLTEVLINLLKPQKLSVNFKQN